MGLLSLLFTSCGSSYTTTHIKDFRVYIETNDDEVRETVYELADEYNSDFGAEALTIVDEQEDANSYIRFISGLRARDNKLGLGQWITITSQEGRDLLPSNSSLQKTVMHTMEIDFDLENFRSKMDSRYEKASGQWRHLYHLFCHEVGHGFQMGHDTSKDSVMYRSIPDNSRPQVDYDDYFRRARKFFNEQYQ
ncbi:hypothetical protein [Pseudobacteriovorax antillogorgiicola]|nr:hypothetical protein [Pseudobacteriovorax antillogorgiicola]